MGWQVGGTGFNLHADMAIYKVLIMFKYQRLVEKETFRISLCETLWSQNVHMKTVLFLRLPRLWKSLLRIIPSEEFSSIYIKMLAHGAGELYPVE